MMSASAGLRIRTNQERERRVLPLRPGEANAVRGRSARSRFFRSSTARHGQRDDYSPRRQWRAEGSDDHIRAQARQGERREEGDPTGGDETLLSVPVVAVEADPRGEAGHLAELLEWTEAIGVSPLDPGFVGQVGESQAVAVGEPVVPAQRDQERVLEQIDELHGVLAVVIVELPVGHQRKVELTPSHGGEVVARILAGERQLDARVAGGEGRDDLR
jgi:hypothetical protein